MKRIVFLCLTLLVAAPVLGGVSYDFVSATTGGSDAQNLAGKAVVEGQNMRIDIDSGDGVMFEGGTSVLSRDGGATLTLVNHEEKTWSELPLEQIFNSLGAMMQSMGGMLDISIDNHKMNVGPGSDGGSIEGYGTTKYVVDTSYDIAIKVMGMNMQGSVESSSEVWSTDELDREYMTFVQQRGFKTGIDDIDELIAKQLSAMKGFPLKVVTRSKTTMRGRTQNTTTNMSISNIQEVSPPDSQFEVPDGYARVETPKLEIPGMQRR